jgi:hypothetical protein
MSLEAALTANTEALNRVAALLEASNTGREAALAAAQSLSSGGEGKAATGRKKADKVAGPPSVDDVRASFAAYLSVDDADEKAARKAMVKKILAKSGVDKATEIPEGDRAQAIVWVKALQAGEDVAALNDEEAEEEDDLV